MTVGAAGIETTGTAAGNNELYFQVTGGSTTGPATITLSNLHVSVPQSLLEDFASGYAFIEVGGTDPACDGGFDISDEATKIFTVSARIGGADSDGTAAQAFGIANPGGNENAVIATDADYQDALSASYLAGRLGTGVLLTPTAALSTETIDALQQAGVEHVYVVGGPDAVSPNVISQLEAQVSYEPGGVTPRYDHDTNDNQLLDVQQIYGATADATAADTAQYTGPATVTVGSGAFQAAYGGAYNDTTGLSGTAETAAPDSPVNTAILATDQTFQDAVSASVVAYHNAFPILLSGPTTLSAPAIQAIYNKGIQQVIVVGGPDAISDAVVTQLEGLGVSVLRVAGQDYTDTSQLLAQFELNSTNSTGETDGLGYLSSNTPLLESIYDPEAGIGTPFSVNNAQGLSFARGDFYSDAIVASQIDSLLEQPLLLTENPTSLGTYLPKFLAAEGVPDSAYGTTSPAAVLVGSGASRISDITMAGEGIFGGPISMPGAIETQIAGDVGPDQFIYPNLI
jgi:putative cell wall-binding protein